MDNFANILMAATGFNWYGFLIGSGMVVCIIIAYIMSVKRGYYKDLVFDIAIICLPLAIVGARLYYVVFDILGNGNTWTFKEVIGLGQHGLSGLAIYGGLIGAIIGAAILAFVKRKKPRQERATLLQMCDLCFTVVILGQIIGRWGNFANQEAYGQLVENPALQWFPFSVFIENGIEGTGYYQATFFYESFLNCFGFALLMWIYNGKRKSFDGFSLSVYCIYYGMVRMFIEGFRSDSLYILPGVRVSQVLSGLLVVFGICMIVAHFYRARARGLKPFVMVPKDKLDSSYFGYDSCILANPCVYEKKKEGGFWSKMFGRSGSELPDIDQSAEDKELLPEDAPDNLEDLVDIDPTLIDDVVKDDSILPDEHFNKTADEQADISSEDSATENEGSAAEDEENNK